MAFSHFQPEVHAARRRRLADLRGDRVSLLAAGGPVSRNYLATTYPFRASSHFLYFIGLPLEHAMALFEGERCTLFLPVHDADHALWEGPVPSFREIADRTGCAVAPLDQLADAIHPEDVATLPAPDARTRGAQSELLARPIRSFGDKEMPGRNGAGAIDDQDLALADAVIELRLRHDDAAIDGLRRAAEATTAAHLAGMGATRPGMMEAGVRAAMEAELVARNMTTAYGSIVTVEGEVLHNAKYHNVLNADDLVLADVGGETHDGWAGDVTRTWPVSGGFSPTQRDAYEVVLAAQKAALAAAVPGTRYRDVHLAAAVSLTAGLVDLGILRGDVQELVADGVHALFFPHGIGHLIGLDVHDMEDLGDRAGYAPGRTRSEQFGLSYLRLDRDLEPGMAVTIEPGFYRVPAILRSEERTRVAGDRLDTEALAKFSDVRGIRIEDDVLITASGNEVLTAGIPKEPDHVEARVGGNLT